jgi:hypothetical protein
LWVWMRKWMIKTQMFCCGPHKQPLCGICPIYLPQNQLSCWRIVFLAYCDCMICQHDWEMAVCVCCLGGNNSKCKKCVFNRPCCCTRAFVHPASSFFREQQFYERLSSSDILHNVHPQIQNMAGARLFISVSKWQRPENDDDLTDPQLMIARQARQIFWLHSLFVRFGLVFFVFAMDIVCCVFIMLMTFNECCGMLPRKDSMIVFSVLCVRWLTLVGMFVYGWCHLCCMNRAYDDIGDAVVYSDYGKTISDLLMFWNRDVFIMTGFLACLSIWPIVHVIQHLFHNDVSTIKTAMEQCRFNNQTFEGVDVMTSYDSCLTTHTLLFYYLCVSSAWLMMVSLWHLYCVFQKQAGWSNQPISGNVLNPFLLSHDQWKEVDRHKTHFQNKFPWSEEQRTRNMSSTDNVDDLELFRVDL